MTILRYITIVVFSEFSLGFDYRIAGNIRGVQISFFSFSVYQNENLTQNVCYDGCVFLCKMNRTKIKHTNQLEITQNEIWTPRNLSAIRYLRT